jgi:membrane-associated phospholipid phosphatase
MRALPWAVLIVATVCALVFLALGVLAFNQHFFDLDYSTHDMIRAGIYPQLRPLMQALSRIASGYVLIPLAVVAYVLLRRHGHRAARWVPGLLAGAFVLFALAKWIVARPRPKLSPYGFPSAHTFGAVVFFGGVIYALWTIEMRPIWRWTGTIAMVLLIAGVAVSRLYLRSHWLSDVVGGVTGGAAYLLFFLMAADPRLRPTR